MRKTERHAPCHEQLHNKVNRLGVLVVETQLPDLELVATNDLGHGVSI
jgi:hypothetical protein